MASGEQRIRSFLFYLCLAVFLIGVPLILSFALSYKFNPRTFKFTKAGLVSLKTQPPGASIYLNNKLLNEKTPATINELLPDNYNIRLELEKHYPWQGNINVEAGNVTRLEKIILFPLRPNIKQLNKEKISSFWVDKEKNKIYYVDAESNAVFRSDLEGEDFEEIGDLSEVGASQKKWKISPDKKKILLFNPHQVAVAYLEQQEEAEQIDFPIILDYSNRKINDVFWHSDSYHLIIVADRNIEVTEARSEPGTVNLVNLNKRNAPVFYDEAQDVLYFLDSQQAPDAKFYDNIYKLELSTRLFSLQDLIKQKSRE